MTDLHKHTELRKYFFKPVPLREKIPASQWIELQAGAQVQTYPKKTLIYREGNHPRWLYSIRKGRIKVYIINNDGAQQIIYFLGQDEIFGHRSILCDEPSPVFWETIEECTIDQIPRRHFEASLLKSPELSTSLFYYLGHEFGVFVHKISVFAQKSVPERVALALLVLDEQFGRNQPYPRELVFSREDLASYTGTATETLIRQLKILKEAGAILIKGRKIILEQPEILWERARVL